MKTNSLLLLASLAVLASSACAASNLKNPDILVLPPYVVTAPRYQPVEQQINASLQEFSRQAATPMAIAPELPLLKAQAAQHNHLAGVARAALAVRVAKS